MKGITTSHLVALILGLIVIAAVALLIVPSYLKLGPYLTGIENASEKTQIGFDTSLIKYKALFMSVNEIEITRFYLTNNRHAPIVTNQFGALTHFNIDSSSFYRNECIIFTVLVPIYFDITPASEELSYVRPWVYYILPGAIIDHSCRSFEQCIGRYRMDANCYISNRECAYCVTGDAIKEYKRLFETPFKKPTGCSKWKEFCGDFCCQLLQPWGEVKYAIVCDSSGFWRMCTKENNEKIVSAGDKYFQCKWIEGAEKSYGVWQEAQCESWQQIGECIRCENGRFVADDRLCYSSQQLTLRLKESRVISDINFTLNNINATEKTVNISMTYSGVTVSDIYALGILKATPILSASVELNVTSITANNATLVFKLITGNLKCHKLSGKCIKT